jgi:predicted DNA-binding WGR domain protein
MQLIQSKGKHNKFWSYEICDTSYDVTVKWGRLGTNGQTKVYKFASHWSAQDFADKKVREKRRKGYVEVETEAFNLKQLQAELVGSGCKIEELTFVKKIEGSEDNLYQTLKEESALANPEYIPLIYCSLQLTGKRGVRCLLIDPEKVYRCWQMGSIRLRVGDSPEDSHYCYRIEEIEEIDDDADKEMKKIRDKAPALVSALIR